MSSASRLDVVLSEVARNYLLALPEKEGRAVAVHLLTFYKNGTPPDSRPLQVLDGETHDRVLIAGRYEILYRYFPEERRVEVGVIRRRGAPR
ncbi:MAG TPA: hypothetical protein VEK11_17950 [Thermoanaerobaculia bacterium]|nr:hypothetical protein [Thermoanaerobaculia bacterium]